MVKDRCEWCGGGTRNIKGDHGEYVVSSCGTTLFGAQRAIVRSARCRLDEARQLCREAIGFLEHIESKTVTPDNIRFRADNIRARLRKVIAEGSLATTNTHGCE